MREETAAEPPTGGRFVLEIGRKLGVKTLDNYVVIVYTNYVVKNKLNKEIDK